MHNTVLQRLQQDPLQSLARFASGRDEGISIVGCFRSNVNYPVWLAKTSSAASGMERLRKERDALAYLQPWSEQFRIPSVLDWHISDGEICLILSGLPGFPDNFNTTGVGALPGAVGHAMSWLEKFQATVPPPEVLPLPAVLDRLSQNLESQATGNPAVRGLIDILRQEQPKNGFRPVITHGDFWRGNVLFGPDGISVIDWDELRIGAAPEDIFTFLMSCIPYHGRRATAIEAVEHTFFLPTSGAAFLRAKMGALGITPPEARFFFYFFIANRLLWKELDTDWQALAEWLRKAEYPTPACFQ